MDSPILDIVSPTESWYTVLSSFSFLTKLFTVTKTQQKPKIKNQNKATKNPPQKNKKKPLWNDPFC